MSSGMVKVLLWAGIIWVVCYMLGTSPAAIIHSVTSGVQTAHNTSVTGGRP